MYHKLYPTTSILNNYKGTVYTLEAAKELADDIYDDVDIYEIITQNTDGQLELIDSRSLDGHWRTF